MFGGGTLKKNLIIWQFACFVAAVLCGTLLHFLYVWTNENTAVVLISAVNESTWEHMKILYFPMLAFSIIQYRYFKNSDCYWWVKSAGIMIGLIAIPILFYTYNGAIGKSPDWLNITFFFIAALAGSFTEYILFRKAKITRKSKLLPFFLILSIGVMFIYFTFDPPMIPLFKDPLTGSYGI